MLSQIYVTICSARDNAVPSAKYACFCCWTQKYEWYLQFSCLQCVPYASRTPFSKFLARALHMASLCHNEFRQCMEKMCKCFLHVLVLCVGKIPVTSRFPSLKTKQNKKNTVKWAFDYWLFLVGLENILKQTVVFNRRISLTQTCNEKLRCFLCCMPKQAVEQTTEFSVIWDTLTHWGRGKMDTIFQWIFLNENVWISIKISLKFVPMVPINNIPALVQIMAWRRSGDKPLSEPKMDSLLTHICVTGPQWVKVLVPSQLWMATLCHMV